MKKLLSIYVFACLALVAARADLIWYEGFNYADGSIITNSGGLWIRHSGSGNDALVKNHQLQNAMTARADDVNRKFCTSGGCSYTNGLQVLYSSFTVNCITNPSATAYFAHFINTTNGTIHYGRVWSLPGTLPGTWRLGISAAAGTVNQIFPVDLATNTDYQVVVGWNPTASAVDQLYGKSASLWVNPTNATDLSLPTGDAVASPVIEQCYAFRQASSAGTWFSLITNLAVATTFDEAATNVWPSTPVAPAIVYQPKGGTNYVGSAYTFTAVANGQGLGNLTYTWLKNGVTQVNTLGNTNIFALASTDVPDTGSYQLAVTTPYGLSATSAVAYLWVTNPPVPPTIAPQPANTSVYYGQTATLTCGATGPGTLSYAWYHNNNSVASEGNVNVSGDGSPVLVIANVQTNNATTGTYRCDVSNLYGTTASSNAVVTALAVPVVTIDYLRGLVDPVFFLPTNTTALWTATGIVTVYTNLTASPNASFMIQDGTAGIGVFIAGGAASLPQAGDSVTVTGPLGQFNSMLQFSLNPAVDPSHLMVTNSNGNPLPAPYVLPLTFTNGIGYGGVSNVIRKYVSSLITFTNVYFTDTNAAFPTGQLTEIVTNANGDSFRLFWNAAATPVVSGQPIPAGPILSLTGPMSYFLGTTAPDRSSGFEMAPTRYEDIAVTAANVSQPTIQIALTGANPLLKWTAQPNISYSILRSTNVSGPYLPLTTGITFNSTAGQYTDPNPAPAVRFYRITVP